METNNAHNVTTQNDKANSHEEKNHHTPTRRQAQNKKRHSPTTIIVRGLKRKKSKKRKSTPIGKPKNPISRSSPSPVVTRKFISGNRFLSNSKTSTFSPILNLDCGSISSSFKTPSCFKRQPGLVRRTHSPMTVTSPVTICMNKLIKSETNLPFLEMGSRASPINEGLASPMVSRSYGTGTKAAKKRKRSPSPKNTNGSRSQVSNTKRDCTDSSQTDSRPELSNAIKIKIVSPTVRGVNESAKILRYGTFSFPTETMYSLVSFIPFKRRIQETANNSVNCQWETLMKIKNYKNDTNKQILPSDPPLLYIHRPDYARHYASFTKPKTFVFKEQLREVNDENQKSVEGSNSKLTAVTFSESYEALERLASAFWPGPITIFAPVKRLRARSFTAKTSEKVTRNLKHHTASSCSSLTSLTSESSDDQPPTLSTNEHECCETSPILPLSALTQKSSLLQNISDEDDTQLIGMRCPSHPLARRVLAEVYNDEDEKKAHSPQKARKRIPGAVLGFNASIEGPLPFSCKDVCSNLLAIQDSHKLAINSAYKPTIHVMNGEDRREMFYVPASQYGQSSLVSMLVDAQNRKVFILRKKSNLGSNSVNGDVDASIEDVQRALYHQNIDEPGSVKSRAITAVMRKWQVCESET